jgi:putative transposase
MPRGPRLDAPGCLHHVIARGIERRPLFADDADREDLLARLAVLTERTGTAVLAWALLPNHFHLLLRTAAAPLSDVMRVLNTGYAVRFNRRHRRAGYLFQNRFKSFLVEEERYLLELVRYIHLNPLRAHLVSTLEELEGFPWTGHAALLGRIDRPWQAVSSVLPLFGLGVGAARAAYRQFVAEGSAASSRAKLLAGGLRRHQGGWVRRTEHIRGRDRWAFDERILGSGEFTERVLTEHAAAAQPAAVNPTDIPTLLSALLQRAAAQCAAAPGEITSSSHRAAPVRGRALFCRWAVVDLGVSSNAVARFLGVTRQSVRRALERCDQVLSDIGCTPEELRGSTVSTTKPDDRGKA